MSGGGIYLKLFTKIIVTILFITNLVFIYSNSLLVAEASSELSGGVREFLQNILNSLKLPISLSSHLVRKLAHFSEFATLGALSLALILVYALNFQKLAKWSLVFGLFVAITDESLQLFTPGRAFQVGDILIDVLGFSFGFLVFYLIFRKKTQ